MAKIMRKYCRSTTVYVLVISLVAFFSGAHIWGWLPATQAAALTSVKDTITVTTATSNSNHTIQFVLQTLVNENDTIVLTFPSGFDLTGIIEDDVDLAEDTDGTPGNCAGTITDEPTKADPADATNWGASVSGQALTLTAPSGVQTWLAASACVIVEIGTNATASGTGANQINNPSKSAAVGTADTYQIAITFTGSAAADSGTAMVAVIEGVTVSVTVDESLSVVIAEVAAASCPTTPTGMPGTDRSDLTGHTDTAMAFETLTAGNAFNHICQQLTISTNASGGYSTTVEKSQLLTSGANTIADGDCNAGSCTTTGSGLWTTTTENGFGYCMDDVTGDAAATADGSGWTTGEQCDDSTPEFKIFGTLNANAQAIMASAAAVSGDNSIIGVVLNYSGAQVPGAYTTTLTFITTPTF